MTLHMHTISYHMHHSILGLFALLCINIQTSMLVVPQAFIECEVRVYDKRKMKSRSDQDRESIK